MTPAYITKNLSELKNFMHKMERDVNNYYHTDIMNIMEKNNVEYTKNSNGLFFDLTEITENCLNDILKLNDTIQLNEEEIEFKFNDTDKHTPNTPYIASNIYPVDSVQLNPNDDFIKKMKVFKENFLKTNISSRFTQIQKKLARNIQDKSDSYYNSNVQKEDYE